MSEVVQTILLGDPSGRPGNCLQAAVASLLDLDLEEVPHFAEADGDWEAEFEAWVEKAGYRIVWRGPKDPPPAFGLAFGFTTRSGERHAVVYRDGTMAWDPHPSRDGLTSILTYLEFEERAPSEGVPCSPQPPPQPRSPACTTRSWTPTSASTVL